MLVIEIAVNFWRARALHRTARDTKSQALAADALHFASDMFGSFAVIAGLILTGLGFWWGDAAAAIAVALIIGLLGLKMTRSTVETLLDRAPQGVSEKADAAIRTAPGVVDSERLRVRMVRKLLRLAGWPEVPVYAGLEPPLLGVRPVFWPMAGLSATAFALRSSASRITR